MREVQAGHFVACHFPLFGPEAPAGAVATTTSAVAAPTVRA